MIFGEACLYNVDFYCLWWSFASKAVFVRQFIFITLVSKRKVIIDKDQRRRAWKVYYYYFSVFAWSRSFKYLWRWYKFTGMPARYLPRANPTKPKTTLSKKLTKGIGTNRPKAPPISEKTALRPLETMAWITPLTNLATSIAIPRAKTLIRFKPFVNK